jgi:hypothetical protein
MLGALLERRRERQAPLPPQKRAVSLERPPPQDSFTSNGVGSSLTDYRIASDSGSHNPWQQSGPSGGRFTVPLITCSVVLRNDPRFDQASQTRKSRNSS